MVRSAEAIDLLLNIIVVVYAFTKTPAYVDEDFDAWQSANSYDIFVSCLPTDVTI